MTAIEDDLTRVLWGAPIYLSPMVKDGGIVMGFDGTGSTPHSAFWVGTRPLTDRELFLERIRHQVRVGMADVLAWCGQDVGPEPERTGRAEALLERLHQITHTTTKENDHG